MGTSLWSFGGNKFLTKWSSHVWMRRRRCRRDYDYFLKGTCEVHWRGFECECLRWERFVAAVFVRLSRLEEQLTWRHLFFSASKREEKGERLMMQNQIEKEKEVWSSNHASINAFSSKVRPEGIELINRFFLFFFIFPLFLSLFHLPFFLILFTCPCSHYLFQLRQTQFQNAELGSRRLDIYINVTHDLGSSTRVCVDINKDWHIDFQESGPHLHYRVKRLSPNWNHAAGKDCYQNDAYSFLMTLIRTSNEQAGF